MSEYIKSLGISLKEVMSMSPRDKLDLFWMITEQRKHAGE